MSWQIIAGIASLLVAGGMVMVGRPRKGGSPKFMHHPLAFALYPAIGRGFRDLWIGCAG